MNAMSFRHSGYVTAVVAALALALVLVSIAQPKLASADHTATFAPTTITADGTTMMTVVLVDGVTDQTFIVANIDAASTGTARFANGGQSIIVINDSALDVEDEVNPGQITIAVKGSGGAGIILVNVTQGGGGVDSTPIQVAYTQAAALGSVQIYSTATSIPATAVATDAQTATVLTARVLATTGAKAAEGTMVTWQAVGQGIFTDTITASETVSKVLDGGAYDIASAENSGCQTGEGTQSCISNTEEPDDGEATTAEPEGSGQASVHFEGLGTPGPVVWTARAGGATGPMATLSGVVSGAVANYSLRAADTFVRANGADTSTIWLTATDVAGNPVAGHMSSARVTQPTAPGAAMTVVTAVAASEGVAAVGGTCALPGGTNASGRCSVVVKASTTQGVNTVRLAGGGVSATIDITLVGANASLQILDAPAEVEAGSVTVMTVEVLDAEGDPGADAAVPIAAVATGTGVVSSSAATTAAGRTTFTFIAGDVDGETTILVTLGNLQTTAVVGVTGGTFATPPTPPPPTTETLNVAVGLQGIGWFGADTTSAQLLADNATIERIWWLDPAGVWQVDSLVLPSSLRVTIQITRGMAFYVVNSGPLALEVPLS